jgi:hypothetical protein
MPTGRVRWQQKFGLVTVVGLTAFVVVKPYISKVWAEDVRPPIWLGTMQMIAAKPVLGHGLGRYDPELYAFLPASQYERKYASTSIFHAHNEPLEIAAEQGLVGLAVMVGLWAFCFRRTTRFFEPQRHRDHRGVVDERQRHEEEGFSNCRAPKAFGAENLSTEDPAMLNSHHDEITKDANPFLRFFEPFCGQQDVYRLAMAGCVLAYLVHNWVDVNSRVPPMQAFGWLMLGLLASAGEQEDDRRVEWRVAGEKRRIFGGLMAVVAIVAGWTAVVQPVQAEYHEQVARIALAHGDMHKASVHAAQSLDSNPYQLEVRFMYAGIFDSWAHQNPGRAGALRKFGIEQCEELRKIAIDYDTVSIRLAWLYAQDGQFAKARELGEWVLARRPKEKKALELIELLNREKQLETK